jgi:hypothetical protein
MIFIFSMDIALMNVWKGKIHKLRELGKAVQVNAEVQ